MHIRLVVLHKSVFISLQFPESLQKRSPGCSQAMSVLGLALGRLVREKTLAGYMHIGLGKRETVRPAVCEMNVLVCACSHKENHLLS